MNDINERLHKMNGAFLVSGSDWSDVILDAASEIERLREENRELQNELVSGIHTCGPKCRKTARCTEMADLRAELAECKDDAKRFIWLANELGLCIMTMNADPSFFAEDDGDAVTAWRKAIDAARKGEGEK